MTWTYTTSLATLRDKVRFLIGDTNTADQQLSDEEIAGVASMLSTSTDQYRVAIACVRGLISKYARQVNTSNGALSLSAGDRAAHYEALLTQLQRQRSDAGALAVRGYVGGVSRDDNDTLDADTSSEQPQFAVGQHDNGGWATTEDET
jgi:hypothetical protein